MPINNKSVLLKHPVFFLCEALEVYYDTKSIMPVQTLAKGCELKARTET